MSAVGMDYEPAGELKIGQVGIANLRIRTLDVDRLAAEMADRVRRAPNLFRRAAVVVDFGGLSQTPDVATARALLDGLRKAGVLPVQVDAEVGEALLAAVEADPAVVITIDVAARTLLAAAAGVSATFPLDDYEYRQAA